MSAAALGSESEWDKEETKQINTGTRKKERRSAWRK